MRWLSAVILALCLSAGTASAMSGPWHVDVLLLNFPDAPGYGCTSQEMADLMTAYGSWLAAESRGHETLDMGTIESDTMPHPLASYNCPIGTTGHPAITACQGGFYDDVGNILFAHWGPSVFDGTRGKVIVFGGGAVGAGTLSPYIYTGGCHCDPGTACMDLTSLQHEGGHAQVERLAHAGDWTCQSGEDIGQDLTSVTTNGCASRGYGDPYNVMGAKDNNIPAVLHFSTFMRDRLHWTVPSNIAYLDAPGVVTLHRADAETTDVQEVRINMGMPPQTSCVPIPDQPCSGGLFYSLEYRPDVGGVLIRYRGNYDSGIGAGTETFIVNQKVPITAADPFIDPYRLIEIDLLSSTPQQATIELKTWAGGEPSDPKFKKGH